MMRGILGSAFALSLLGAVACGDDSGNHDKATDPATGDTQYAPDGAVIGHGGATGASGGGFELDGGSSVGSTPDSQDGGYEELADGGRGRGRGTGRPGLDLDAGDLFPPFGRDGGLHLGPGPVVLRDAGARNPGGPFERDAGERNPGGPIERDGGEREPGRDAGRRIP